MIAWRASGWGRAEVAAALIFEFVPALTDVREVTGLQSGSDASPVVWMIVL
jgi:hypothetical protein